MREIINFYDLIPDGEKVTYFNPNYDQCLISHPAKILICGKSGSSKTNLLLNLIMRMRNFDRYYLFVKMLSSDPLYDKILLRILQMDEQKTGKQMCIIKSNTLDDLPSINDPVIDPSYQNIVIFDDLGQECEKNLKKVSAYFTKMRKKNCTLVFIAQNYTDVPVCLRRQTDVYIFTTLNSQREKLCIYQDIGGDVSREKFFQMMDEGMGGFDHFIIDMRQSGSPLKFRSNFTKMYVES